MKKGTILLTGATGFLGSHLLEAMVKEEYSVVILKRSFSDTWRIKHLLRNVTEVNIDIEPLENAFQNDPEIIIHTATNYGRQHSDVHSVMDTNLFFPMRLLDLAARYGVNLFINADTMLPRSINTYSLTKNEFSELLRQNSEITKTINMKIEYMYGPKDDTLKFICWFICQLTSGHQDIALTKGDQRRDLIHVKDVAEAFMIVIRKRDELGSFCEFDIGTGKTVRVKDLVLLIKKEVEQVINVSSILNFGAIPMRPGEPMELRADTSKIKSLGWNPSIGLNTGIQQLVRAHIQRTDLLKSMEPSLT